MDKCQPADLRGDDFNIYWVPTTYYDGGYETLVGGNINDFLTAINNTANRTVYDVDVDATVEWLGNATMRISASVTNNEAATYEGHIRVYINELVSSLGWNDTTGSAYTHPMLEFAMNESISVAPGATWLKTVEWDGNLHGSGFGQSYGNIQFENIQILAAVFNDDWHQGYSDPPSSKPFDAYYADDVVEAPTAALTCDTYTVPESGGAVNFTLSAGAANHDRKYLIVGGASGTSPGMTLPGGMVLPVNWDWFSDLEMALLNTVVFANFLGTLDGSGKADAQLLIPALPSGSAGLILHFAFCLNKPFDFVSNPVEIEIVR